MPWCSEKVTACGVFLLKMQNLNLNLKKHHINASEEYSTCQGQKKYKERLRNYYGWEETTQTSQLNATQNLKFDLETTMNISGKTSEFQIRQLG